MSLTYDTFVAALSLEAVIQPSENASFSSFLPTIIDQAEQLIYRDLDLIATIVSDQTGVATPNQRQFSLPQVFVVLQSINLMNGTVRTPLTKTSREVIDFFYPDDTGNASFPPKRWGPLRDQVILLGPSPASAYTLECIGTVRPANLSETNQTTFISQNLPDLMMSAAMYYTAGYKQNWGAQSDNPGEAISWKSTYDMQLKSADAEEMRRKYQATAGRAQ